jgi:predicted ATP-dependent endonuclease of OLD family
VLCSGGETLLIEEPDSHLHRAAIDSLWEFFGDCAKRNVQVICATHSQDLLVSMYERISYGVLPKDSAVIQVQRSPEGQTTTTKRDATLFRDYQKGIKEDLAKRDL